MMLLKNCAIEVVHSLMVESFEVFAENIVNFRSNNTDFTGTGKA
jgi:hypothetical protein